MALLQHGEIDMAFVTECKAPEGVRLERLQSFELSALMPQSHPLAHKSAIRWDDLRRERLLLANRPQAHARGNKASITSLWCSC